MPTLSKVNRRAVLSRAPSGDLSASSVRSVKDASFRSVQPILDTSTHGIVRLPVRGSSPTARPHPRNWTRSASTPRTASIQGRCALDSASPGFGSISDSGPLAKYAPLGMRGSGSRSLPPLRGVVDHVNGFETVPLTLSVATYVRTEFTAGSSATEDLPPLAYQNELRRGPERLPPPDRSPRSPPKGPTRLTLTLPPSRLDAPCSTLSLAPVPVRVEPREVLAS